MPALFSRHFPQPDLSTVVAPSGGVQPTAITQQRGSGHRTSKPAQERVHLLFGRSPEVTSTSTDPLFSCSCQASPRLHSDGVQSLMGCKQYARMLGLSRGYPYILYLSLGKWDAAPLPRLFHKVTFQECHGQKFGSTMELCHLHLQWFPGRVAAQTSGAGHAIISARVELRRFRSEMGKFRRFSRGFSTAEPMVT